MSRIIYNTRTNLTTAKNQNCPKYDQKLILISYFIQLVNEYM